MRAMIEADIRARCEALAALAKQVRVLGSLTWHEDTLREFLTFYRRGDPVLPKPSIVPADLAAIRRALDAFCQDVDPEEPIGAFLARTARSYERAAAMLEAAGQPAFAALSAELYQHPRDIVVGTDLTHVELAKRVLALTDDFQAVLEGDDEQPHLGAESVREELQARVDRAFPRGSITIAIDPSLASKAAASGSRVRIRGGAFFTPADVAQLAEHEIFVHSATQQNGRAQPLVTALGLGAPRTTATQEGLATFAELVTGTMDLGRLRRIALRVEAVDRVLAGANFLEVFRFFLEAGQSEDESARSAMRVFRGGDVRGGVAFTKDCVYLPGLVSVHTFLRSAIAARRPELLSRLFVGRLTVGDVLALEPAFADGRIAPAAIRPDWISDPRRVAASLVFSVVVNGLSLGRQSLLELSADAGRTAGE